MAKFDLKFIDCIDKECHIQTDTTEDKLIVIRGLDFNCDRNIYESFSIYLDISTAIKFAKTLRTQINKAKEVNHG